MLPLVFDHGSLIHITIDMEFFMVFRVAGITILTTAALEKEYPSPSA
jgi:hypothetical protein